MGTRGYRAWRFRKRYYFQYNHWDSYPEGLGQQIVAEIPKDHEQYLSWLEQLRKEAEDWEAKWLQYIIIDPMSDEPAPKDQDHQGLDFMSENHPSWLAPMNDLYIEWVYIIDLDRDVFTINNSVHFKLKQMPHIDWIEALGVGKLHDQIVLPGVIPDGACVDLVEPPAVIEDYDLNRSSLSSIRQVTPKTIAHVPWRRRHGPILAATLFYLWSKEMEDPLAATLLQWSPEDLPFREIAFAVLCLVSGARHVSVIPNTGLEPRKGCGVFDKDPKTSSGAEFIGFLNTEAHLKEFQPSASPKETIYWLDNVLVFLDIQLFRPQAVQNAVSRVIRHCQNKYAQQRIDAIIISIEHVVLVHIIPGFEITHTGLLPLFEITNHLVLNTQDRYTRSYLQKLVSQDEEFMKKEQKKRRKAQQQSMLKNEGINMHFGDTDDEESSGEEEEPALCVSRDGIEGDGLSTFFALTHVFDAAARRRLAPAKTHEGVFPNELYGEIIKHITDKETHLNCMEVSRTFREHCQENIFLTNDKILQPSIATERCVEPAQLPRWFEMHDTATGTTTSVQFKRAEGFSDYSRDAFYAVAIGKRNHRRILPEVAFRLPEFKE